jgi:2-polyprenyl-6-hydroxyphenyl methylase/3-demethylubiquinone-9 3-methyltransferase
MQPEDLQIEPSSHSDQVRKGQRFEFGKNWSRFLASVDEERIAGAVESLRSMLRVTDLGGKAFLDVGCGSGLFSLAALRLGATVRSFDYDPHSVACAQALKAKHAADDSRWSIEEGSVLDESYVRSLGSFDVVYSWGVLHHTGAMWSALENVSIPLRAGGKLFIALYNDQGWISSYWTRVKKLYNSSAVLRAPIVAAHAPYLLGGRVASRAIKGQLRLERGMSIWYDMIDWLGGYPFEVARPEAVIEFFRGRGFTLDKAKTCGGRHGCNEFVFVLESDGA